MRVGRGVVIPVLCLLVAASSPGRADGTAPQADRPHMNPEPEDVTCDDVVRFSRDTSRLALDELLALGQAYDQGRCVQRDYTRAYGIYRRTAERGSPFAALRLGYLYVNGLGVERDEEKARYWFRSQALATFHQRDPMLDALLSIAFFGGPIPEMMRREVERAREEANGPPEVTMRNYRDLLAGRGVFPARERALGWLYMAVEKDHPEAFYDLATRHLSGNGVFKSEVSYQVYLREAARRNHAGAQKELGLFYLQSNPDTVRIHDALVWLLRARRNGLDVTDHVQAAERLLSPKHRRWAQEEADDFDFEQ